MRRRSVLTAIASLGPAAFALAASPDDNTGDALLEPWSGSWGGLPPFDRFGPADFAPALRRAMAQYRRELAAIASNPAAPTFDNTLAALEDAGRAYGRIKALFYVYTSAMNDARMQQLQRDLAPLIAAFHDECLHDAAMFKRVTQIYEQRTAARLSPEQQRLAWFEHNRREREGAGLDPSAKARVEAINLRLAMLYTDFSQHQLADEEQGRIVLDDPADVDGLSESLRADAAAAATRAGLQGRWLIANTRSAMEPFITYAKRRELRHRAWTLWIHRGDNGDANDNNAIVSEIVRLRAERARLFGYPSHAHWVVAGNMAKSPDAAMALMMKVWKAAVARVRTEVADMQAVADAEGAALKIEPWDYRYFAEKVRKARYDVDGDEIKPYLQLDKIREAMFWAAGQVDGLTFQRLLNVPVYHADMSVYEVRRSGRRIGLWYFDPYARDGKESGAWMSEYRTQERFRGAVTPIVSNNANFTPGRPGEPVLISWDDATTMFHEFGHALHGLLSNVRYPSLAGTAVLGDFVEFPSQLNERWLSTPEVLSRFAVHYKTGEQMPAALMAKIERSRQFNQGFATAEYLSAAIYDMKIHLTGGDGRIDPGQFETQTMAEIGCPPELVMRHRPTHFGHIFADEGYSAGYYDYLWAETLTADATEAFTEAGGLYDKAVARRLHACITSVGNSVPPDVAFRCFRGRDLDGDALMRALGFLPRRPGAGGSVAGRS